MMWDVYVGGGGQGQVGRGRTKSILHLSKCWQLNQVYYYYPIAV